MGGFSTTHLLILGFIALLLFGNRLPSVMRSLGKSVSEFKKGLDEVQSDVRRGVEQVTYEPAETSPPGDGNALSGAHQPAKVAPQGDPFTAEPGQASSGEATGGVTHPAVVPNQGGESPELPAGPSLASRTGPS
jgi:sec-independent protein translocase protein TatA